MDRTSLRSLATALSDAYLGGPIDPPSAVNPELTIDDAYAVQELQIEQWVSAGRALVGHKVGLTAVAIQRQLGVDEPDFGAIFRDTVVSHLGTLSASRFLQPRIEPEIGFVLGRSLRGPGVSLVTAAKAIDAVFPALEIIDSRVRDWNIKITDTIADNASGAGVVLGSRFTRPSAVDLRLVGAVMHCGGRLVGTGAGGAVLGSPLLALVWLANTLGARGVGLEEGQIILPGSVMAAHPIVAGQTWTATFAQLGPVTVSVSDE